MGSVKDVDIARWRLRSQRLTGPHASSAGEVVGSLLAVQAENPSQSAWAVACRTATPDPAELADALASGAVVRTHVLRPTWHYVAADDIVWLLELTGPKVNRTAIAKQLHTVHGLDDAAIARARSAVLEALGAGLHLTRDQLAAALTERGVAGNGHFLMILLAYLELSGLVVSGRPNGTDHTYALLADRVPDPRRLDRDEALAELALRYFTGHGPATERDLAYWATLGLTEVRTGLAQVRDRLETFEHEGRTYWHAPGGPPRGLGTPRAHLLQLLDESYRGYQDSRMVLDQAGIVPRGREAAIGMALVDGQMVAGMRRTVGKEWVEFRLTPFRDLAPDEVDALLEAADRYGAFLGSEPRLTGLG